MKILLILFAVCAASVVAYWVWNFYSKYQVTKQLLKTTVAYNLDSADHSKALLVLGDSTGVGVGAQKPEDSVAGRLAISMGATYVENRAVSGAQVADIAGQLSGAELKHYYTILIDIGGNDIVRFHDAQHAANRLQVSVEKAVAMSNRVILVSAGNVGAVTNFPIFMRPFYTSLTLKYHAAFGAMADKAGAIYVNLYTPPAQDPFEKDPNTYLSPDGFHPSSAGYGLWFEHLEATLQKHGSE